MSDDPYPFESDDDEQIRELDLDSLDAFADERITVGDLVGENESWRYGHVIVDEAQDLSPMQWRMIMRRVRGQSLTIVGDLAQRSTASVRSWSDLLPNELSTTQRQDLTINYRSPVEIHRLAVDVLAAYAPDVAPSRAIRVTGEPVQVWPSRQLHKDLPAVLSEVLGRVGGQVAVLALDAAELGEFEDSNVLSLDRVRFLTPNQAKGLEFDAVVIVEPGDIWSAPAGPAQLYIALTRATQYLVVLHDAPLPAVLAGLS